MRNSLNQCGDNIPRQSPTARNLTNLTKSIKIFVWFVKIWAISTPEGYSNRH